MLLPLERFELLLHKALLLLELLELELQLLRSLGGVAIVQRFRGVFGAVRREGLELLLLLLLLLHIVLAALRLDGGLLGL